MKNKIVTHFYVKGKGRNQMTLVKAYEYQISIIINLCKVYNLFSGATKSSYIDTFLDRNVGSLLFINSLVEHLRDNTKSWFLS